MSIRSLARIPHQLLVALGVVVLIGTLAVTALLSDKNLAVAVAIAGTFLGTALICIYLPRLIGAAKRDELRRELDMSRSKQRLDESEGKRHQVQNQLREAEREIARLESMRINLEAFRPILKLGLLEVETNVTDFQHRPITPAERKSWWRAEARDAYAGVVQIPVTAHLGIDLQKVRLLVEGNAIIVSGLEMTNVTDTGEGAKWLLDEIRTEYVNGGQVVKFRGDAHDRRAKAFSREHELQVRARLKKGLDFKVFEAGLIRTAQQVLGVLLAPLGKEIQFEATARDGARALLEFLTEHNRQVSERIAGVKSLTENT